MTTEYPPPPPGWAIVPADDPRLLNLPCRPMFYSTASNRWYLSIKKQGDSAGNRPYALPINQPQPWSLPPPVQTSPPLARQEGGSHYARLAMQPVEFIHANKLSFLEGCVIKRLCRHRHKGGAEDIRKAIHELELILSLEYPEGTPSPDCPDQWDYITSPTGFDDWDEYLRQDGKWRPASEQNMDAAMPMRVRRRLT